MIHVVLEPMLIVLGTIGNLLTFYVMRRGSLKDVSTCFYMSILALADKGVYFILFFFTLQEHHTDLTFAKIYDQKQSEITELPVE